MKLSKQEALDYHSTGRKGKIEVIPTKPCLTQRDLSLAYTPGVAEPCLEIEKNPQLAFEYTAKGNLVAVVSNGTAVLGLGNIGALAGKPVMEGITFHLFWQKLSLIWQNFFYFFLHLTNIMYDFLSYIHNRYFVSFFWRSRKFYTRHT